MLIDGSMGSCDIFSWLERVSFEHPVAVLGRGTEGRVLLLRCFVNDRLSVLVKLDCRQAVNAAWETTEVLRVLFFSERGVWPQSPLKKICLCLLVVP